MEKKFKTNINCGGCIANVKDYLDQLLGQNNWEVNTAVPEKILTVKNESVSSDEIMNTVKNLGYKIESIDDTKLN